MKLRLSVKRFQNSAPDSPVWADFSERGGTLGRGERCDWILADPEVSRCHARVFFLNGRFQLEDTSTNGIFVNNSPQPLGLGNTVPLNQGDTLTLSDYEIFVDVVPSDEVLADRGASTSGWPGEEGQPWDQGPFSEQTPFPTSPRPSTLEEEEEERFSPIPKLPEEADISLQDVGSGSDHIPGHEGYMEEARAIPEEIPEDIFIGLEPDGESCEPPRSPLDEPITASPPPAPPRLTEPPRAARQPDEPPPARPAPNPPPASPFQQRPRDHRAAPTQASGGTRDAAQKPRSAASSAEAIAPPDQIPERALQQFLNGAGVSDLAIPPQLREEFFFALGALLREAITGAMELLRARTEIRKGFRIPVTMIRPVENNPLKLAVRVEEALSQLLAPTDNAYLPPMQAVEEAFSDMKAHQLATMAGMQMALSGLLKQFEPHALENCFNAHGGKGLFKNESAWFWEQYTKRYSKLIAEAEDNFEELFGEEFARAYEQQVVKVRQLARRHDGQI